MRVHRLIVGAAIVAIAALPSAAAARAQEGAVEGFPITPDPAECAIDAAVLEDGRARIDLIAATPTGSDAAATPEGDAATPAPADLPEGDPADPATVEIITLTMRQVVACMNTGNPLTIAVFSTDAYLGELLAQGEIGDVDSAETPAALPAEQYATIVAVRDVRVLDDGRVGAIVETTVPADGAGSRVHRLIFVEQDGRWLIDEVTEVTSDDASPEAGTPTA